MSLLCTSHPSGVKVYNCTLYEFFLFSSHILAWGDVQVPITLRLFLNHSLLLVCPSWPNTGDQRCWAWRSCHNMCVYHCIWYSLFTEHCSVYIHVCEQQMVNVYSIYAGWVVSSDSQLIINATLLISDANASRLMTELAVASLNWKKVAIGCLSFVDLWIWHKVLSCFS